MQRPATWKIAAVGAALTGLSFISAGTAVAATHTDATPVRSVALAGGSATTDGNDSDSRSTSGNNAGSRTTDSGDASQPNGERLLSAR